VCILPTLSHVTDAFVLAEVDHLTSRARLCLLSPKAAFSEKEQVKLMGLTRESIQEPKMAGPFIEEDSADEEEEKTAVGDPLLRYPVHLSISLMRIKAPTAQLYDRCHGKYCHRAKLKS
jgi:hypothetical protein